MVVPNNHGLSYSKWSFWGVWGVETPKSCSKILWGCVTVEETSRDIFFNDLGDYASLGDMHNVLLLRVLLVFNTSEYKRALFSVNFQIPMLLD